jgi:hypothetical protein
MYTDARFSNVILYTREVVLSSEPKNFTGAAQKNVISVRKLYFDEIYWFREKIQNRKLTELSKFI